MYCSRWHPDRHGRARTMALHVHCARIRRTNSRRRVTDGGNVERTVAPGEAAHGRPPDGRGAGHPRGHAGSRAWRYRRAFVPCRITRRGGSPARGGGPDPRSRALRTTRSTAPRRHGRGTDLGGRTGRRAPAPGFSVDRIEHHSRGANARRRPAPGDRRQRPGPGTDATRTQPRRKRAFSAPSWNPARNQ